MLKKMLVILPTYNEADNLPKMVDVIKSLDKVMFFRWRYFTAHLKKRFRIKEIPIIFYGRKYGTSKMNKKEVLESLFIVLYLKLILTL